MMAESQQSPAAAGMMHAALLVAISFFGVAQTEC